MHTPSYPASPLPWQSAARQPTLVPVASSPSSDSERSCDETPGTANVRAILSSIAVSAGGAGSPKKKRRRDDEYSELKQLQQPKPGAARAGPPLTATHEIRFLRKEVANMENHLQQLETKWVEAIPEETVLASACQAAKEKWMTSLVEQDNAELRDQLTQQQFIFASLQSTILQAPLQAQCREMWDAIHLKTRLSADADERVRQLQAHCDAGIALTPEVVEQFTNHIASSATPYSQTNITGGASHTFVSNVFVMELPHTSLLEVFQATLGYYAQLHKEMQRCLGTRMAIQPLNLLATIRQYAKVTFMNEFFSTTVNTIFAASMVDGVGVIHSDVITSDPLHPMPADEPISRLGLNAITLTPVTDAATGKICKIVLRRVIVYRYSVLPHDPVLHKDMKLNQCVINGDLFTAMICQNLRHQRPELVEQAGAGTYSMD